MQCMYMYMYYVCTCTVTNHWESYIVHVCVHRSKNIVYHVIIHVLYLFSYVHYMPSCFCIHMYIYSTCTCTCIYLLACTCTCVEQIYTCTFKSLQEVLMKLKSLFEIVSLSLCVLCFHVN